MKGWKHNLAIVVVTIICTLPVALGIATVQAKRAQRHSDVVTCTAVNNVYTGVALLGGQLHADADTLALIRQDFPALDCAANPISFAPAPQR